MHRGPEIRIGAELRDRSNVSGVGLSGKWVADDESIIGRRGRGVKTRPAAPHANPPHATTLHGKMTNLTEWRELTRKRG